MKDGEAALLWFEQVFVAFDRAGELPAQERF